ncbi:pickpocket protein 28-like isoform X4 [Photinus pyralis]|uniref:Pickpocket protein 28 n=1 Tax=Photinus pyralis TaxID=7054 RepID=A0A1Y1NAL7_PHOPY|nr:pickpocket protein 28-like isoform X4 [Photinus pyralis]
MANVASNSVTICPQTRFDTEIFNFTDIILKKMQGLHVPKDENEMFETLSMVCSGMFDFSEFIQFTDSNKTIDDDAMLVLYLVLPEIYMPDLTKVKWLGQELDFDTFIHTYTSEGLCYTFNMLPYDEVFRDVDDYITKNTKNTETVRQWSLDGGYPTDNYTDSYPRRTFLSGIQGGLLIDAMYSNTSHLDYLCDQSLQGYKVALHHPCEIPNMDKHFRLPLDQAVFVSVKPVMITISEDLLHYKPEDRKCYLGHEKYLHFYKHYTQENCLRECLANYTIQECGCVGFNMPTTSQTVLCGLGSIGCMRESKMRYLENETDAEFGKGRCNCWPSCTSLSYDVETSQIGWDWHKAFEVFDRAGLKGDLPDERQSHFSRLNVYYKDLQFLSSERNELYGYVDFFSNVGGLMGLFIGISVTSCVEILYFLTLRLVCNIRKYGRRVWSGEPELIDSKNE